MPQTASAWMHTYLGTPMVNGRVTQYGRKPSLSPPQGNVNQTTRQFVTLQGPPTPGPEGRCHGGVHTNTSDTETGQRAPVPQEQARQQQRSRDKGSHAGPSRDSMLCSSPLEDAGVPGVTATGSSSNPRRDQQLTLLGLQGTDANIAWQFLSSKSEIRKASGFFLPLGDPTSHCGGQALLLETP